VKRPVKAVGARRRAELIDAILDEVAPMPERRSECLERLEAAISVVQRVHTDLAAVRTPVRLRRDLRRLAATLKRARALADDVPANLRPLAFRRVPLEGFVADVDRLIADTESSASAIVGRKRQKPGDPVRYASVSVVWYLINDFAKGGRGMQAKRMRVGSFLYEIVTGTENADLSDYKMLHDDSLIARLDGRLIVRLTFAG
jgi:hypothetical protein